MVNLDSKDFMVKYVTNNQGQAIALEYVVIFFLAITVVTSMSIYMRRAIQGRAFDTHVYAMKKAARALGNSVPLEYEPYYAQVFTNSDENTVENVRIYGNEIFVKETSLERTSLSATVQRPPSEAQ